MPKLVQRHQSQLYLLPPDLRDWLPEDDLAHVVVEAVERVPLERFQVNDRGTGSAQYHPRMMLALLVYGYANGILRLASDRAGDVSGHWRSVRGGELWRCCMNDLLWVVRFGPSFSPPQESHYRDAVEGSSHV